MTYEEAVRYLLTLGRELASPLRALGLSVIPSAARNLTLARLTIKPLIAPARGQMPRQ